MVVVQAQTPAPIAVATTTTTTAAPTVASVSIPGGTAAPVVATSPSNETNSGGGRTAGAQWGGCVGRNGAADRVRLGQATRICWHVANGVQWSAGVDYVRAAFEPVADTYARLHIPNCTYIFLLHCRLYFVQSLFVDEM
jgi:hypothetical protein